MAEASSACPICGEDTPHFHPASVAIADGRLYTERVLRPQFERVVAGLFKTRASRRGFGSHIPFSEHRDAWTRRIGHEYADPGIQEFWTLWMESRDHALAMAKRDVREHQPLQHVAASPTGEHPNA